MSCISWALGFLNKALSFCTFLSHGPLQQGTISTISHWCDGFQALLPVLLIKQNEADCSRWLRVDRSRYCYQCTKKPFIKVLSDPKLWIYQSLLTNGIKPSPVWVRLEPALLRCKAASSGNRALSSMANEACLEGGTGAQGIFPQEAETCSDWGMGALLVRMQHASCLGKWALHFWSGRVKHAGQLQVPQIIIIATLWNEVSQGRGG